MIALSVNLNKIALLRNSREGNNPCVLDFARRVLEAGARGITVHPRPDQRHIRPSDVYELAELLAQEYPGIEFNIEGNPLAGPRDNGYPGFDALIQATRPAQATLVPDSDNQLTSDHGWDLSGDISQVSSIISNCQASGARVSLFIDPNMNQIVRARDTGADRIELYTGPFAEVVRQHGLASDAARRSLEMYQAAARKAHELGLGVNAGHDLDLVNLPLFREIGELAEVSIGHALITDALIYGMADAVTRYLTALTPAPQR